MKPEFQIVEIKNQRLPENLRQGVVAIGNFDGVHRGHRAVLDQALKIAEQQNCPAIVLTFEPHPRTFFAKNNPVFRLTSDKFKAQLLRKVGFDAMIVHEFDRSFAGLSADEFIDDILLSKMSAAHIVTGHDFHFGTKRSGTPQYLEASGNAKNFDVTLIEPFHDENSQIISSSAIRTHLENGDLAYANALLGYAFQIQGVVVEGKKLGRTLGFPTANIHLPTETKLRHGIYAVRVVRENGERHDGVASYGRRPTFDNGQAIFETFLLDFEGDLYGENLNIILYSWLREELKFDGADALVAQMEIDKVEAKQFLSTVPMQLAEWPQHLP